MHLNETRSNSTAVLDTLASFSNKHSSFEVDTVALEANFDKMFYEVNALARSYCQPANNSTSPAVKAKIKLPETRISKFDGPKPLFGRFAVV